MWLIIANYQFHGSLLSHKVLIWPHMDYSPWSEREIWPNLKVAISPKQEGPCPPNLVCMHWTSTSTCIMSWFYLIQFFDTHWYSPWSEREIWPNLKANFISKTGNAAPTKIGVHAFDTNLYLHENLEPILFVSIFWTPWTEREVNLLEFYPL